MDDLKRMAIFAAVVRHRSMSGAARAMGLSVSAVSQQVRLLERVGGVTLLHRTTRKLTLTDAGERVFAECAAMLDAAERAQRQLVLARDAPSGELRLSSPVGLARHLAPALAPLLAAHPALTMRLLVDDAHIDLVAARVDLAVRFGRLPDSRWVAKRLGRFALNVYASPAYLMQRRAPQTPAELSGHQWLGLVSEGQELVLSLQPPHGAAPHALRVTPRISSNNQLSLQQMCVAGLGLAVLGALDTQEDLLAGRLVPVLPQWQLPGLDVWAVTPQRDAQPAKVRHAIAALQDHLADLPGVEVDR